MLLYVEIRKISQLVRSVVSDVVVAAVTVVIGQSWWLAAATTQRPPLSRCIKWRACQCTVCAMCAVK